jgi:hypothetical protein
MQFAVSVATSGSVRIAARTKGEEFGCARDVQIGRKRQAMIEQVNDEAV